MSPDISVLLALTALCSASPADAQPTAASFNPLFQDHMVLQRGKPVRVWGQAAPGSRLNVALAGDVRTAISDPAGRWAVEFAPREAASDLALTLRAGDGQTVRLTDVAIGDVFLCSGQSNMDFPVNRALNPRQELARPADRSIRLLKLRRTIEARAAADIPSGSIWAAATPATTEEFSAICLFFGRRVAADRKVPVGLIHSAWGGTRIESWMSASALRTTKASSAAIDLMELYARDPHAGQAAYGRQWEHWWSQRGRTAGKPWMAAGDEVASMPAMPALGNWRAWNDPAMSSHTGTTWFYRPIRLTAAQAEVADRIMLGAIAPNGAVWLNGRFVGGTRGEGSTTLALPAGSLHPGENMLAVAVVGPNPNIGAGLMGPAMAMRLGLRDGAAIPIDDGWRYRRAEAGSNASPPAPWEDRRGIIGIYNAMIAPLGVASLAGVLWYQGENNADTDADGYAPLLATMKQSWRTQFRDSALPFITFQLANFGGLSPDAAANGWSTVREAQRRVTAADPNAALVVLIDIGDRFDIHPPNKQVAAERAYRAARTAVYRERGNPSGPWPAHASREGDVIIVDFDDVSQGLVAMSGKRPNAVMLCGADGKDCRFADATVDGSKMRIEAPSGAIADKIRYCWGSAPICNLYDRNGDPVGPFEIDVVRR